MIQICTAISSLRTSNGSFLESTTYWVAKRTPIPLRAPVALRIYGTGAMTLLFITMSTHVLGAMVTA